MAYRPWVRFTYRRFSHVESHEEEELCDEEVNAQVLVDGVAIALQPTEKAEGEDADGQADEWHGHAHARDHAQKKIVDASITLKQQNRTSLRVTAVWFSLR